MIFNLISTKEILDFEKEIGHELEVNERKPSLKLKRFYIAFKNSSAKEDGCLVGYYGDGDTIDEALISYCQRVQCKTMVFNCYSQERTEIEFPKLVHTKFINR